MNKEDNILTREYPKKCPKCNEYMEPVFDEGIRRRTTATTLVDSIHQEPIGWKCVECGYEEV